MEIVTFCLSPALHPYVVTVPGWPDRRFSNFALALETVQGRRGWRITNELNGEVWMPGMMWGVV